VTDPPVTAIVTVDVEGAGVPALEVVLLPFFVVPHPALANNIAKISTVTHADLAPLIPRSRTHEIMAKKPKASVIGPGLIAGGSMRRLPGEGGVEDGAVVAIVSVADAVVAVGLSVTAGGLKLQLDCAGSPEHAVDGRLIVPLKPFAPMNVRVADPVAPGAETTMFVGLIEMTKLGVGVTVSTMVPLEAP
jgi:hypothetical protein